MKKLLGFVSLTLIALLTACNADNLNEIAEAGKDDVLSEADRVPVQLSISPSSNTADMTRAPLATSNGNFETPRGASPSDYEFMGVFALAQTNTPAGGKSGPVATGDIKWNGTVAHARPLWNQPMMATIVNNSTSLQFIDKASLNSTPSPTTCYYPVSSWYNYYFYTYYPRVDDSKVYVSNNNVVTADYSLNGSQDIVTGVAKPATNPSSGYCSKYYRDNSQADLPQVELKHRLTQLRFFVRTASNATSIRVTDIRLLNVPTEWSLTIADKSDIEKTGTLSLRNNTTKDIPVRTMAVGNDYSMTSADNNIVFDGNYSATLNKTPLIAGYAMVPTTDMLQNANFSTTYEVRITYIFNDEEFIRTGTLTPSDNFQPQTVYNINITVNPAGEEITDERIVDLGLSVKWAKWNIGAQSETEKGDMFTWGSTHGYSSTSTSDKTFSKINDPLWKNTIPKKWRKYGDGNKTVLDEAEDAASINWDNSWCMPTIKDYQELMNNTTQTWQTNYLGSGVDGMLFTSNKEGFTDKSIFFPVSGYRYDSSFSDDFSTAGYYWSSEVYQGSSYNKAYYLGFSSSASPAMSTQYRYYGLLIRAVKKK